MNKLGFAVLMMVAVAGSAGAQKPQPKPKVPEIPASHRPPRGMCRIWLKDVPASQQPAATDCAAAVKNNPPNGTVIFGDTRDSKTTGKVNPTKSRIEPKSYRGGKRPIPVRKPPVKPPA